MAQLDKAFFVEIQKALEPLINKADCLAYNSTTNQAERYVFNKQWFLNYVFKTIYFIFRYMSLVAKFTGGKRVNFTKGVSYTARAIGAGISHMYGPGWHTSAWAYPGNAIIQSFCLKRNKALHKRCVKGHQKRTRLPGTGPDKDYGPECAKPDMPDDLLGQKMAEILHKLQQRALEAKDIEIKTRGQHDNALWRELRTEYLTSSNFGTVVKMKKTTHPHNFIRKMLYPTGEIRTPSILYGRTNERTAIRLYEEQQQVEVQPCGLFIDTEYPFLASSPDGIVNDDILIEVKCLPSIKGKFLDCWKPTMCYEILDNCIRYLYQNIISLLVH